MSRMFARSAKKNLKFIFAELLCKKYQKGWKNLPIDEKATFRPKILQKGSLKATNEIWLGYVWKVAF